MRFHLCYRLEGQSTPQEFVSNGYEISTLAKTEFRILASSAIVAIGTAGAHEFGACLYGPGSVADPVVVGQVTAWFMVYE